MVRRSGSQIVVSPFAVVLQLVPLYFSTSKCPTNPPTSFSYGSGSLISTLQCRQHFKVFHHVGVVFFMLHVVVCQSLSEKAASRAGKSGRDWLDQLRNESTYLVLFLLTFLCLIFILLLIYGYVFLPFSRHQLFGKEIFQCKLRWSLK